VVPIEYLNKLNLLVLPNHVLKLKVGLLVILLRNINQGLELCYGIRLLITHLERYIVEGKTIPGNKIGTKAIIPRIVLSSSDPKFPFVMERRQYPLRVGYAMTINKSQ